MKPVWIIDDDRSIRWVFEKALAREGIAHRTFQAAREALDLLPGEAPQVVVSDIRMPGLSGLELMQQLKSRLPATPVIRESAAELPPRSSSPGVPPPASSRRQTPCRSP